jgi:hypothetical protein
MQQNYNLPYWLIAQMPKLLIVATLIDAVKVLVNLVLIFNSK